MTDKEQTALEKPVDNVYNRQNLLILSSSVLEKIEGRLTAERFRSSESDNTYLAFVRAFSSLMSTHNATLRDSEIAILESRVAQLEKEKQLLRIRE